MSEGLPSAVGSFIPIIMFLNDTDGVIRYAYISYLPELSKSAVHQKCDHDEPATCTSTLLSHQSKKLQLSFARCKTAMIKRKAPFIDTDKLICLVTHRAPLFLFPIRARKPVSSDKPRL
jgi:hypothetical protein